MIPSELAQDRKTSRPGGAAAPRMDSRCTRVNDVLPKVALELRMKQPWGARKRAEHWRTQCVVEPKRLYCMATQLRAVCSFEPRFMERATHARARADM